MVKSKYTKKKRVPKKATRKPKKQPSYLKLKQQILSTMFRPIDNEEE